MLYRLGRAAYERPWGFIAAWLFALAAIGGVLAVNPPTLSNEVRIDGTPAQQVIDDLSSSLPEASGGQGLIAFQAPGGARIDAPGNREAVLAAVEGIYQAPHVIDPRGQLMIETMRGPHSPLLSAGTAIARADAARTAAGGTSQSAVSAGTAGPLLVDGRPYPGVLVSADGTAALLQFQFDVQPYELPPGTVDDTVAAARDAVRDRGIAVLPSSTMLQVPELFGVGEVIGVFVAALVLVIALGSLVAAGLPLVGALLGVAVGIGGAFVLAGAAHLHSLTATLAIMLGLSVGIDYALFIVNRQRSLILDQRLPAAEATARAVATAGAAVVFAGATVIIALTALLVVNIRLLTTMALVAAGTVAVAVCVSLTLLPALLGLVGERICSARARSRAHERAAAADRRPLGAGWGRVLIRGRFVATALTVAAATAVALPISDLSLGLPSGASYNVGTPYRLSHEVVAERFGPGYNGPLLVVAEATEAGRRIPLDDVLGVKRSLDDVDGVHEVSLAGMDRLGTTALFMVIPSSGPNDEATKRVVEQVRDNASRLADERGVDVGVTGFTALAIDVSGRLGEVMPIYLGVVLTLSMIVLLLVFRSLVIPLLATAGFALSVLATFGATVAVFQWGWLQALLGMDATAPIQSLLPIIVTGVLYGLAMDYQVFLVSSIREARLHGHRGNSAIERGLGQASRVVVAAAIIMTAVFAGFVFSPEPMVKQLGFALGIGVLIDAFVIRMTLVPAALAIVGDRAWWLPRAVDRILPNLDVEGAAARTGEPEAAMELRAKSTVASP